MPTVAEILKSAGMGDEDIAKLDAKAVTAMSGVLTAAEQAQQQAELAQRAAQQMFENEITPALNGWGQKEANLTAERDYYKTLATKAKDGGFVAEVPPFQAGAPTPVAPNVVPGMPSLQELEQKLGGAFGTLSDLQWQYRSLHGREMPDAPTALASEAAAQRMSLAEYAAKKYDFAGRKAAMAADEKKKSEDAIRKAAIEETDKKWAEKIGSNPNVRQAQVSNYSELKKGVTDGKRPDPLKLGTREQRHAATRANIQREVEASATIQ